MMRWLLPGLLLSATALGQRGDEPVPVALERNGPPVLRAFERVLAPASSAVATVLVDGRPTALATVVAADGLLLSKASELEGALVVRLADGRELSARRLGRDLNFDLVLLRVEARDLTPAPWSVRPVRVGRLVVSAGAGGGALGVGLIGVAPKVIRGGRARLGVVLAFGVEGAVIARVSPDTPAAVADLRAGDRILAVEGDAVDSRATAARALREHEAGERVRLRIERAGVELELEPVLAMRASAGGDRGRSSGVEGDQSDLRAGFPSALQHDTVIAPQQCGGPLVGLNGRVVGVNIARAGRVATFAVPAADLRAVVERLRAAAALQPGDGSDEEDGGGGG